MTKFFHAVSTISFTKFILFLSTGIFFFFYIPNALSFYNYRLSDIPIFYAVFHQMSQGVPLYQGVYDIKDPWYFHIYGLAYQLFGAQGPAILETLLVLLAILLVILILSNIQAGRLTILTGVAAFMMMGYKSNIYYPLHTFQLGITLLLGAILAAQRKKAVWCGTFLGIMIFAKMPLIVFIPGVTLLLLADYTVDGKYNLAIWWKPLLQISGGGLTACSFTAFFLLIKHEFWPYLHVIRANFYYSKFAHKYLETIRDQPSLFTGMAKNYPLTLLILWAVLIVVLVVSIIIKFQRNNGKDWLSIGKGCAWLLMVAAWFFMMIKVFLFTHHLSTSGLGALVLLVGVFSIFKTERWLNLNGASLLAGFILIILIMVNQVTPFFAPQLQDFSVINVRANETINETYRTAIKARFGVELSKKGAINYAVLGSGGSSEIPAVTPPEMKLACRHFVQFPWINFMFDEMKQCMINNDIDYVFYSKNKYFIVEEEFYPFLQKHFQFQEDFLEYQIWVPNT